MNWYTGYRPLVEDDDDGDDDDDNKEVYENDYEPDYEKVEEPAPVESVIDKAWRDYQTNDSIDGRIIDVDRLTDTTFACTLAATCPALLFSVVVDTQLTKLIPTSIIVYRCDYPLSSIPIDNFTTPADSIQDLLLNILTYMVNTLPH